MIDKLNVEVQLLSWSGTNLEELRDFIPPEYNLEQVDYRTLIFDDEQEVVIGDYFVKTSTVFDRHDYFDDEVVVISPEVYREWREEHGK